MSFIAPYFKSAHPIWLSCTLYSISGLVVKSLLAMQGPRVRFPADADQYLFFSQRDFLTFLSWLDKNDTYLFTQD